MRCKSRKCPECGQLWAGDQRRRLVANLDAYDGPVMMATITAPGSEVLRHDESGHVRAWDGRVWNRGAPRWWRVLHHRAAQEARRQTGQRPVMLAWVWQYQRRGLLHKHVVLGLATAGDRAAAHAYVNALSRFASECRFGFVDRGRWDPKRGRRSLREMSGKHAGRYVAKYLVQRMDDGRFAVSETVTHDDVPPLIVYVARALTDRTGVTMRSLREWRFLVVTGTAISLEQLAGIVLPEYRPQVLAMIAAANAPPP